MSEPVATPTPVAAEAAQSARSTAPNAVPSSAPGQRAKRHPFERHGFLPAVQTLTTIIILAIFIVTFTVQPFRIPSGSMEPTLMVGDFLLVDKQVTASPEDANPLLPSPAIQRGDVIVFHYPLHPEMHLVKRVVGLPGDHLRLRGGHVQIDGRPLAEPYAIYRPAARDRFRDNFPWMESADPEIDSRWWARMRRLVDNGELIVPEGNYFVLGDNRNDSEDSRYWGFVPQSLVVGRPLLIYFSLRRDEDDQPVAVASGSELATGMSSFARWRRMLRVVR